MRSSVTRLCGILFLLSATACASSGSQNTGTAQTNRRDLLTQEQIQATNRQNAFEVVETLRSNWLRPRGQTSLTQRSAEVLVYVNNQRVGGVDQLRAIPAMLITSIQWYDGIAASGRWGLDHGAGVIMVNTSGR